jgi:polyphosphate kinase 2 (PPK2 family)
VRVHRSLLRSEGLADEPVDDEVFWNERFRSMVDLERHLHANGTRIVKVFLHLSKDEQRRRFVDRIDAADKNWKFTNADISERKFWDAYMAAYEQCMSATSTQASPWYIVPADDKESARLIVSRIVLDALRGMKMAYPVMSSERKRALQKIRRTLAK